MNRQLVDRVTKAVLYEGYLLYPYRASAIKNQHRWTFGALYPVAYSRNQGGFDPAEMRTECLIVSTPDTVLKIRLRFLQLISRESFTAEVTESAEKSKKETYGSASSAFSVAKKRVWQEASDREVVLPPARTADLLQDDLQFKFGYAPEKRENEGVSRRQELIEGSVAVTAELLQDGAIKIVVIVRNESDFGGFDRNEALLRSTVSTHVILNVENGEFVSLFEPPEPLQPLISCCKNVGNWPVLIGENGERDTMLASPIILYDHPQVAPESAGDLFDSTEIDEILMLRILTLTDDEKKEIRQVDDRARQLLDMTENLPPEQFMKLHGAIRGLKKSDETPAVTEKLIPWDPWEEEKKPMPSTVQVFGKDVKKGDRVRLWPVKTADILDLALNGRTAIVDSIEQDYDGRVHLAVVVEDDPGKDLGELRQPGHRFFFTPEEVEPL